MSLETALREEAPHPRAGGGLHLDFAFSPSDTPALRDRITRDLTRIVEAVRGRDPAATAVILTGGFARGEGATWNDAPLNDYDLVVVRGSPLPKGRLYEALSHELEGELGLHVDLLPAWGRRLRHVDAKVFWYETREAGQVIWGPRDLLERTLPPIDPARLPWDEAARVLFNRAAGLLLAFPGPGRPFEGMLTYIQSSKALLACIEARLLLAGRYHHSVRERLARFQVLAREDPRAAAILPDAEWATAFKLAPQEGARGRDPTERWSAARAALLATLDDALRARGYASVDEYGARAPVALTESAVYALHARSVRARPSAEARRLCARLLEVADHHARDDRALVETARGAWFSRDPVPDAWPALKDAFFAIRGRTLQ